MPKVNLSVMTVEALMDLRVQVDETLLKRRAEIEKQLARMGAVVGGARIARRRGSALKGKKVPPKYRSPSGETWAGRGVKPRWHPLLGACTEEISHEGLVSHRSALRGRNVRHHPDLTASNAEGSRAECRSGPGLLWALPPGSSSGV
jgi:DNA-binding protein H-NS